MVTIRDLRRAADMTQTELAEKIGCTQKDVSRWERGQVKPSAETLRALSKVFGVSMDSITTPRKLKMKQVLTKSAYTCLDASHRRSIVKYEQVREYSKWGDHGDTFSKLTGRIPAEWWALYSAEHLADIIDLLERSYSDGVTYGRGHAED